MIEALLLLAAQAAPITAATVPDPVLAEQRGGFRLPNGVDVALTVQTQTAVDGALILRTVFRADQGPPSLTVYTPRPGETVTAGDRPAVATANGANTAPVISYDPRSGIQVIPGATMPAINISTGAASAANAAGANLQSVDASGAGVVTDAGQVTAARTGALDTVQLRAGDLTVTHFAGNAFGSIIANMGDNRTIDTQTSVAIDLSNAGPDVVGSAMMRVLDLGSAVSAMRVQ